MSLATRISAFFLLHLAIVLAGFSGTLYYLARTYLVRQLDDRLQRALDTLEAAVDIEPGGLEWEPADRRIALGVDSGMSAVRWSVRDGRGTLVDRSANAQSGGFPDDWTPGGEAAGPGDTAQFGEAPGWRLAGRRLLLDELLRQGRGHPDDEPGYEVQYSALVLTTGLSPAPVEAAMTRLALTLAGLSIGAWVVAAAVGHGLSRRALAPMRRMARGATAMTAADLGQRLPVPGTADELGQLGDAFNGLLDRLNEAFESQRRFAGDASHQLRNPLTALLGQVQLARRRERTAAEYREVLDRVQEEAIRLRQIVESLLLLADPGASAIDLQQLDLASWLPQQIVRWSTHPRARDLRVELGGGRPLGVRAHPPLLAQLVDNLLDNALKYSPPGSPVVIKAGRDDGKVVLGVEDRGLGLNEHEWSRVFEPFYRVEQVRHDGHSGAGLGLAVARRIAHALGGTIGVGAVPEGGSVFLVRLPAVPAEVGAEACGRPLQVQVALTGGRESAPRTAHGRRV